MSPVSVLDRAQLEESPLADLHALAAEVGLEGFRRLRREDLIDALLGAGGGSAGGSPAAEDAGGGETAAAEAGEGSRTRRPRTRRPRERAAREPKGDDGGEPEAGERPRRPRREPGPAPEPAADEEPDGPEEVRIGVLHVLGNGSGFLRSDPYRPRDDDAYVAPAQIRRCELRSADEVSGPVRPARRSERHPSLVRVDSVNGAPAEPPAERPHYEALTAAHATERLAAPDGLAAAPFGKGSRVAVWGPPASGVTTVLRAIGSRLVESHPEVELHVVLAAARPEEVVEWSRELSRQVAGGGFDAAPEERTQGTEVALERAKRAVERGAHAAILVEGIDTLPESLGKRLFGAARRAEEGGSLTVIASLGAPGLERYATTLMPLEARSGTGGTPSLAPGAGTLRAEALSD